MIFFGGVEIKLVDFGGSVVPFQENLGEAQHFIKKVPEWGEVGICSKKLVGGRYLSKEMGYLMHQIWWLQSFKWADVTNIWTHLLGGGRQTDMMNWGGYFNMFYCIAKCFY